MANLTNIPAIDGFETTLASSWNGAVGTVSVLDVPSGTIESGETSYIVVNPGKSNMQVAKIDGWDSGTKTFNVTNISVEKGNGVDYTAQSHAANSVVRFSNNYAFWKDIRTAVNSKAGTDTSNTWTGTQTFDKVITTGYTKDAIYADDTARDTAIPSPSNGMRVYNTAVGLFQKYQAGAWIDDTSGASTPNASTTVAGKVEIATTAERIAHTATGATGALLVPDNASTRVTSAGAADSGMLPILDATGKLDNSFLSVSSDAIVKTFTAGENLTAGDFFKSGSGANTISQQLQDITYPVGYDNSNYEIGQSFTPAATATVDYVSLYLTKTGTPTQVYNMEIFSNTGTTLLATSTNSVTFNNIVGQETKFYFDTLTLTGSTTYYFKMNYVSGTISTTNYATAQAKNATNPYAGGQIYIISNTNVWTPTATNDIRMIVALRSDPTKKYKALATQEYLAGVEGIVNTTVTTGNTFTGTIGGTKSGYTLGENKVYYLTDAGSYSTVPGTVSTKVGRAVSATELNFIPPL